MQPRTPSIRLRAIAALPLLVAGSGLLLVGSCGGAADPAELTQKGSTALNSGDAKGAQASFTEALKLLEPGTPEYMRAKMGEIECLIQLEPERAKTEMLALGPSADEDMYAAVASKMCSAKRNQDAVAVLDAGIKLYAESPQLKTMMDKVIAEAEKQGDAGTLDSLKGLGYIGGE